MLTVIGLYIFTWVGNETILKNYKNDKCYMQNFYDAEVVSVFQG